ncbi:hypothetical protein NQ176_g1501 [Zarea fungicola]|uniref:Uncharacterized protein n=1 Tax=Zarea fungicola TaxID=93591 RepID=A0ACC1NUN0_9HYPO|nr:hypothetical protein NQ176_g1501 [Lecanicillium fungicola]
MSTAEHYDCVVLGSGEPGKYIAWTLGGKLGKKCAVIERKYLGGSCPNIACLPSKNVIHSAGVVHDIRQAASFGVNLQTNAADIRANMSAVESRKADMVEGLRQTHITNFESAKSEVIFGEGTFVGPKVIEVAGRRLTADTIIINTGSRAFVDSRIPGLLESKPLTHVELLDLKELPEHLVILGGGYIGMEFAQAYRRLGSKVTVIEKHDQILAKEDRDVVDALVDIVAGEGVEIITSAKIGSVTGISGAGVELSVMTGDKSVTVTGSHLLAAAGRTPNTQNIGLEEAGIELTPAGHVKVDEQLKTTVDGVYAVGDCAGSPYFTHIGFDDFRIVLSSLTGSPRHGGVTDRQVPSVLFTSHELAHVGLREHEAQSQGIKYRLGKLPMKAFLRTRTQGDTRGFAKVLVEADGERILGFTALGLCTGDLLPVIQLAMKLGVSYKEISTLVIAHPTLSEGLIALLNSV